MTMATLKVIPTLVEKIYKKDIILLRGREGNPSLDSILYVAWERTHMGNRKANMGNRKSINLYKERIVHSRTRLNECFQCEKSCFQLSLALFKRRITQETNMQKSGMEEVLFMSVSTWELKTRMKSQESDHSRKGFWPDSIWLERIHTGSKKFQLLTLEKFLHQIITSENSETMGMWLLWKGFMHSSLTQHHKSYWRAPECNQC